MTYKKELAIIILAAGKGTRMQSDLPKVLHSLGGKPIIDHVIARAERLGADRIIGVVSPDMPEVEARFQGHEIAYQHEAKGTGHALKCGYEKLGPDFDGDVLMVYGDHPLVTEISLSQLIARHMDLDNPAVTILGFETSQPTGYGRLVTSGERYVSRIIEEKDATQAQRRITLCNGAAIVFDGTGLKNWLPQLGNDNAQNEYYAVDIPEIAGKEGRKTAYILGTEEEMNGVNTQEQLAQAKEIFFEDPSLYGVQTFIARAVHAY